MNTQLINNSMFSNSASSLIVTKRHRTLHQISRIYTPAPEDLILRKPFHKPYLVFNKLKALIFGSGQ